MNLLRKKIENFFVSNPDEALYCADVVTKFGVHKVSARICLKRMADAGLVLADKGTRITDAYLYTIGPELKKREELKCHT